MIHLKKCNSNHLLPSLLLALVLFAGVPAHALSQTGVSKVNLNLRAKPNGRDLGTLKPGEKFTVLDSNSKWLKIKRSNGKVGWVFKKYVRTITEQKPKVSQSPFKATNVVKASSLNMRSGPGKRVIGSLKEDEQIQVLSQRGAWSEIVTSSGQKGFVFSEYLNPLKEDQKEEAAIEALPLAEEPKLTAASEAIESLMSTDAKAETLDAELEQAEQTESVQPEAETRIIEEPRQKDDEIEAKCDSCGNTTASSPIRDLMQIPEAVLAFHKAEAKEVRERVVPIIAGGCSIGSPYGMRRHPILGYKRMHDGQDVKTNRTPTPVRAPVAGKVLSRGTAGGYGRQVVLQMDTGAVITLNHLSSYGKFKAGSRVKPGDILGKTGSSGLSTGIHLHIEAFTSYANYKAKRRTNPLKYFTRKQICGAA